MMMLLKDGVELNMRDCGRVLDLEYHCCFKKYDSSQGIKQKKKIISGQASWGKGIYLLK